MPNPPGSTDNHEVARLLGYTWEKLVQAARGRTNDPEAWEPERKARWVLDFVAERGVAPPPGHKIVLAEYVHRPALKRLIPADIDDIVPLAFSWISDARIAELDRDDPRKLPPQEMAEWILQTMQDRGLQCPPGHITALEWYLQAHKKHGDEVNLIPRGFEEAVALTGKLLKLEDIAKLEAFRTAKEASTQAFLARAARSLPTREPVPPLNYCHSVQPAISPPGYVGAWPPVSSRDGSQMPVEFVPQFHAYYALVKKLNDQTIQTIVGVISIVLILSGLTAFKYGIGAGLVGLAMMIGLDGLIAYPLFRWHKRSKWTAWRNALIHHNLFLDIAEWVPPAARETLNAGFELAHIDDISRQAAQFAVANPSPVTARRKVESDKRTKEAREHLEGLRLQQMRRDLHNS